MKLRPAEKDEFECVRDFYWELIDLMQGRPDTVGWKKGIYPSDSFLSDSIDRGELYILETEAGLSASVILNSSWNEGYDGLPWSIECGREDVLVPHALGVHPSMHMCGIGTAVVSDIISIAKALGKKTVRLDILKGNTAAERLYSKSGFSFVGSNDMFYEDTGLTEFLMYELIL